MKEKGKFEIAVCSVGRNTILPVSLKFIVSLTKSFKFFARVAEGHIPRLSRRGRGGRARPRQMERELLGATARRCCQALLLGAKAPTSVVFQIT